MAGAALECAGPLRVLLGWVSREPVPSYPTLTCHQSSEGGEKPSALSSRGENLLHCLLLGGWKREQLPRAGAFHICHPPGGYDSGEALCPLAAPRAKASAPLQAPESRPCAVRCPCPATRRHLRTGRGHAANPDPLRAARASRAGDGASPAAAGARRHSAARGAEGGGDSGFPWSRRVTSPAPVPIPGFSYE